MNYERLNWLDVARGIAMLGVVFGHMFFEGVWYNYFFSFQVSMFFILSGISYGVNDKYQKMGLKEFCKVKWRKLVIPYFWLNIIFFPIFFVNNFILLGKGVNYLGKWFLGVFYSNQSVLPMTSYSTWFLTCLFLVSILFKYLMIKFKNNLCSVGIISFLLSAAIVILSYFGIKMPLPWHLHTVFVAILFYYLGYCYIKYENKIKIWIKKVSMDNWVYILSIVIMLLIGFIIAKYNGKVSLRNSNYKNPFLFYLGALITSFGYIFLSKIIKKCKILEYIGCNTLIILTTHRIIMRFLLYISPFTKSLVYKFPFTIGIIMIVINVPIIYCINKYLPFVIGKKKTVKSST